MTEEIKCSLYAHWGGYPAAVSVLDGFQDVRQNDPVLAGMLAKLDALDRASRDDVVQTMLDCRFDAQEMNRICSPVLDGVFKALTGRDPRDAALTALAAITPPSLALFTLRLVFPKPYPQTLRWLLSKPSDAGWRFTDVLAPTFLVSASIGLHEIIELLLPHAGPSDRLMVLVPSLERAVRSGHVEVVASIVSALSDADKEDGLFGRLLACATANGLVDMSKFLLAGALTEIRDARSKARHESDLGHALGRAICGGHELCVQLLLQECGDLLTAPRLTRALEFAIRRGQSRIAELVLRTAQNAHINVTVLASTLFAVHPWHLPAVLGMLHMVQRDDRQWQQTALLEDILVGGTHAMLRPLVNAGFLDLPDIVSPDHLELAALTGDDDVVVLLIQHGGARIWSDEALLIAAAAGRKSMVDVLLECLAGNETDRADLLRAEVDLHGLVGLVTTLSALSARFPYRAFKSAVKAGQVESVRIFASLSNAYLDDDTLRAIVESGQIEVVRLLMPLQHESMIDLLLEPAVCLPDPAMLKLLVDTRISRTLNDSLSMTATHTILSALHTAASMGRTEHAAVFLPLLTRCAKGLPNAFLESLAVAVSRASADRCLQLAVFMIEYRLCAGQGCDSKRAADPMEAMDQGLIAAVKAGEIGSVQLHLDAGADVHYKYDEAARLAQLLGHAALSELLRAPGAFARGSIK